MPPLLRRVLLQLLHLLGLLALSPRCLRSLLLLLQGLPLLPLLLLLQPCVRIVPSPFARRFPRSCSHTAASKRVGLAVGEVHKLFVLAAAAPAERRGGIVLLAAGEVHQRSGLARCVLLSRSSGCLQGVPASEGGA